MNKANNKYKISRSNETVISGKRYIVKSVFVGDKNVKTILLKLAERKAIKDMGLDNPIHKNS